MSEPCVVIITFTVKCRAPKGSTGVKLSNPQGLLACGLMSYNWSHAHDLATALVPVGISDLPGLLLGLERREKGGSHHTRSFRTHVDKPL